MSIRLYQSVRDGIWGPKKKSGLRFWFDLQNAASITYDGSNRISQIQDLSGRNLNATQFTNINKPIYTTSLLNGYPGAVFTSSNQQCMDFTTTSTIEPGLPASVVVVCENTAGTGTWYQAVIGLASSVTNRNFILFFNNDASYSDLTFNFVSTTPGSNGCRVTTSFSSAATAVINYNGGTSSSTGSWAFYKNNASATVNTSGGGAGNGVINRLGAQGNTTPGNWFNGKFFEAFGYDSQLTADELNLVDDYVANKWGI